MAHIPFTIIYCRSFVPFLVFRRGIYKRPTKEGEKKAFCLNHFLTKQAKKLFDFFQHYTVKWRIYFFCSFFPQENQEEIRSPTAHKSTTIQHRIGIVLQVWKIERERERKKEEDGEGRAKEAGRKKHSSSTTNSIRESTWLDWRHGLSSEKIKYTNIPCSSHTGKGENTYRRKKRVAILREQGSIGKADNTDDDWKKHAASPKTGSHNWRREHRRWGWKREKTGALY